MRDESSLKSPFVSLNGGHGNGYGNGSGNGHYGHGRPPLLMTGRDLARITNDDASQRNAIGGMLVAGEMQLVWPTVPQAAVLTVTPMQGMYSALHMQPKARLLATKMRDATDLDRADIASGHECVRQGAPGRRVGLGRALDRLKPGPSAL